MRTKAASAKIAAEGKERPFLPKQSAAPDVMHTPIERLFSLQGSVGNQGVQRIRTELKIAPPNDRAEQEADRAAERALRRPETPSVIEPSGTDRIGTAARGRAREEGEGMPDSVRSYFEPRFGKNLGAVRLHTDSCAAALSRSLSARAFTVGRDVFFGAGEYAPQTVEGKRLIAHELAHVLQQDPGPAVIRRKINFDPPTYNRINPIDRILNNRPIGLTTPTINATQLPDDFNRAGQMLLDALLPKQTHYKPDTKECTFVDFDPIISANVIIPTEPTDKRWTMDFPGAAITGITACHDKKSVPVVMTAKPSSEEAGKWIEKNEEEHVDDLRKLYKGHLQKHFDWTMSLKLKGDDHEKCPDLLMKALGNKDAVAINDFLKEWLKSIQKRDEGGKHTLHNDIKERDHCARIEIESKKK